MAFRKPKPAAVESPLPGYSELTEIGGGAFATVYRAVEAGTGRAVALKILKVDTIHAHLIETFHQEIQALAKVSDHPNIVTLYRPATTSDGRPVLVLELCRGSLGSRVRTEGPMDPQEVTRIGVKIAGALETAHRNGFLHRDMKPQNILVTNVAEPALADFGVAALQASAQATAGVFGFTTLHAAPEMLEGQHLSPATDVYGLASTMYQLLTGKAPFASYENEAPASVILRILRDPVRPLRSEHIPLALSELLEAALSKQPEGRPRTALEFARALHSVEEKAAWPGTDFLAWGEEGDPVRSGPVAAPGPAGFPSWPAGGESLHPTAPSVRVEGFESSADRFRLPPLLPAGPPSPSVPASPPAAAATAAPAAAATAAPAATDPAPPPAAMTPPPAGGPASVGEPAAPAGGPADDEPAAPAGRFPDPPPASPPAPRRSPAVAAPEPGERRVVIPEQGSRGQPSPPIRKPAEPLPPLGSAPQPASPAAPGGPPSPPPPPGGIGSPPAAPEAPSRPEPTGSDPAPGAHAAPAPPSPLSPLSSDLPPLPPAPAPGAADAVAPARPAPPRPVFVDPEPVSGTRRSGAAPSVGESVYEETMAVSRLFTASQTQDPAPEASRIPVWIVAGLGVAVAVIVVAVLLLTGIL